VADRDKLPAGLLQTLVEAQAAGQLGEDELLANSTLLLFAAHTTMQQLIPAGILALIRHPDQLQLLRDSPALIPSAVEEMLRYISPTQLFTRQALEDVQLGDKFIRAGDLVRLHLYAANHDPEQFPEPDRFDIRRTPNPHFAFGGGMHHCLGFLLARLEASVVIETLLRRLSHLSVADDAIEWEDPVRLRRLKKLPVTF
jgi:cytochrome P450